MYIAATDPQTGPGASFRDCLAAWIVALTLLLAMVAGSILAMVFAVWI